MSSLILITFNLSTLKEIKENKNIFKNIIYCQSRYVREVGAYKAHLRFLTALRESF